MRLKAARFDAQILANRLKGVWLIVKTGTRADYKIVPFKGATKEDKKGTYLKVSPNFDNITGTAKQRQAAYKMRRSRAKKINPCY